MNRIKTSLAVERRCKRYFLISWKSGHEREEFVLFGFALTGCDNFYFSSQAASMKPTRWVIITLWNWDQNIFNRRNVQDFVSQAKRAAESSENGKLNFTFSIKFLVENRVGKVSGCACTWDEVLCGAITDMQLNHFRRNDAENSIMYIEFILCSRGPQMQLSDLFIPLAVSEPLSGEEFQFSSPPDIWESA